MLLDKGGGVNVVVAYMHFHNRQAQRMGLFRGKRQVVDVLWDADPPCHLKTLVSVMPRNDTIFCHWHRALSCDFCGLS